MDNRHVLRFQEANRNIFEAINAGKKKVETRAATVKYKNVKVGDALVLVCGKDRFEKKVKAVKIYKSIAALVKKYQPNEIIPGLNTVIELEAAYYSFPDYKEKISKVGLLALELK